MDVLAHARGEYFALAFRRGITHGVPAMVLLSLLVTTVVLGWDRRVRRRRRPDASPARAGPVLALAFGGVLTHPVLDWVNTYGMRWWMPFDGTWTYGDAVFIIDPWLWLLLGAATFLGERWSRRAVLGWGILCLAASLLVLLGPVGAGGKMAWTVGVAAVVVARRAVGASGLADPRGRRAAVALTAAAGLYVAGMVASDLGARADVRAAAREAGLEVVDLMVAPAVADPLAADVEVVTPEGYVPGAHHWLATPRVTLRPDALVPLLEVEGSVEPATVEAVLAAARRVPHARDWLVWSRHPYVRVRRDGGGWIVGFADARYDGRGGAGGLSGVTVRVDGPPGGTP